MKLRSFQAFKKRSLKNPEVKAAYDALAPEFELASKLIGIRVKRGLTQAELAKKMGTKQSAVARLESGTNNSTIKQLERLAKALDAKLTIKIS
ncbi:MAG: helix-turn-helix domain-containing protein [Candidatus Uhrbacteria bacterium]